MFQSGLNRVHVSLLSAQFIVILTLFPKDTSLCLYARAAAASAAFHLQGRAAPPAEVAAVTVT